MILLMRLEGGVESNTFYVSTSWDVIAGTLPDRKSSGDLFLPENLWSPLILHRFRL